MKTTQTKDTSILTTMLSLYETINQLDFLYKESFGSILADYTITEMHCVDCIGKLQNPNVTRIAQELNLTKAAISKSIKKLLLKEAIKTYKNPDNKKEIYYELTQIGQVVFEKHLSMHEFWCIKDREFFEKFKKDEINSTLNVLSKYNEELQKRLEDVKKKEIK